MGLQLHAGALKIELKFHPTAVATGARLFNRRLFRCGDFPLS
jgi:hypothetical protein